MFAKSLFVSLALGVASVHAGLFVSTPDSLKQCEEATFVITGANGAVWPFVVNPSTPCDDPLRELNDVTGDLKWKPDLPVGTNVMVAIEDEAGDEAWSGALTIQPGSDSSCVQSNSSAPSSAPSSPAASPSSTYGVSILGGPDTPQNAVNSSYSNSANSANSAKSTSVAAPAPRFAVSPVTALAALSAFVLAL